MATSTSAQPVPLNGYFMNSWVVFLNVLARQAVQRDETTSCSLPHGAHGQDCPNLPVSSVGRSLSGSLGRGGPADTTSESAVALEDERLLPLLHHALPGPPWHPSASSGSSCHRHRHPALVERCGAQHSPCVFTHQRCILSFCDLHYCILPSFPSRRSMSLRRRRRGKSIPMPASSACIPMPKASRQPAAGTASAIAAL